MDNPNTGSHLRRHNSLPTRLQRRTSVIRSQLHLKSNPYVGCFRHSPPTTFCSASLSNDGGVQNSSIRRWSLRSTLLDKNSSPYIGWFRHAPPSKIKLHRVDRERLALLKNMHHIALMLDSLPQRRCHKYSSIQLDDIIIDGRLRGGGKDTTLSTVVDSKIFSSMKQNLELCSQDSSSATVKILARLGAWMLAPLAEDEFVIGKRRISQEGANDNIEDGDDDESSTSESDDDSISTVGTQLPISAYLQSNTESSSHLDRSVSDIAEAYYAHQASKDNDRLNFPDSADDGNHRLDYVITQMDIARMARTASRHLNVDSILSLPTITYRSKMSQQRTTSSISQQQKDEEEGWSWMMVQSDMKNQEGNQLLSDTNTTSGQGEADDDVCVICLDKFVNGDRLRVLPCDHSFHVGCIDRWLSGSHSYDECFTSGCPTCKKRPDAEPTQTMDGSVPSWAFARLGNAMAQASSSSMTA